MKTKYIIVAIVCGISYWAMAQSSGSGNSGGTKSVAPASGTAPGTPNPMPGQPPRPVPGQPNQPQPGQPPVPGTTQPSGATPGIPVSTNGGSASGYFTTNSGITQGFTNSGAAFSNTNLPNGGYGNANGANGNAGGGYGNTNWSDFTNANGTVTYNTNIPHWWEKR